MTRGRTPIVSDRTGASFPSTSAFATVLGGPLLSAKGHPLALEVDSEKQSMCLPTSSNPWLLRLGHDVKLENSKLEKPHLLALPWRDKEVESENDQTLSNPLLAYYANSSRKRASTSSGGAGDNDSTSPKRSRFLYAGGDIHDLKKLEDFKRLEELLNDDHVEELVKHIRENYSRLRNYPTIDWTYSISEWSFLGRNAIDIDGWGGKGTFEGMIVAALLNICCKPDNKYWHAISALRRLGSRLEARLKGTKEIKDLADSLHDYLLKLMRELKNVITERDAEKYKRLINVLFFVGDLWHQLQDAQKRNAQEIHIKGDYFLAVLCGWITVGNLCDEGTKEKTFGDSVGTLLQKLSTPYGIYPSPISVPEELLSHLSDNNVRIVIDSLDKLYPQYHEESNVESSGSSYGSDHREGPMLPYSSAAIPFGDSYPTSLVPPQPQRIFPLYCNPISARCAAPFATSCSTAVPTPFATPFRGIFSMPICV